MAGLSKDNPLKDVFNIRSISLLGERIQRAWPEFPNQVFQDKVLSRLGPLGLGDRCRLIRDQLYEALPEPFPDAISILTSSLGPELHNDKLPSWDSFIVMPLCAFVSEYGKGHVELSLRSLYEPTKRFTAEGDLRTFLEIDFEKTLHTLFLWRSDLNAHVRRLVSEGTRPRLPLAPRIRRFQKDPQPVLKLLEGLHRDPSEYVRRSVANNLNDISKDHPDLVLETLERWNNEDSLELRKLIRHASRTLIKMGQPRVMALLGYTPDPQVVLEIIELNKTEIIVGDTATVHFTLRALGPAPLVVAIDYVIAYVKSKGTSKEKVFKYHIARLVPGQLFQGRFTHHFRNTSSRRLYAGEHSLELQINGQRHGRIAFSLTTKAYSTR